MAQQQHPETTGAAHYIEKGWTVWDAVEHPIGTVTDVDSARSVMVIDGRPVGLGSFEIPLDLVAGTGGTDGNEVRLTKVIELADANDATTLRMVDPPPQTTPASTARTRGRSRAETTGAAASAAAPVAARGTAGMANATSSRASIPTIGPAGASTTGRTTTTTPTTGQAATNPTPGDSFSQFSPPYARSNADTPTYPTSAYPTDWGDDGSSGWGMKKIGMAALAVGGLAAAGYLMRRRARRKTPYERFMASASGYMGVSSKYLGQASGYATDFASEVARQRNPAWWAALAAAALPLAYYAWPTSQPTYTEQAKTQADTLSGAFAGYLHEFANRVPALAENARDFSGQMRQRLPSSSDLDRATDWMPSSWRNATSNWSMPDGWAMKPDIVLPVGLLAVSALALYLARRATSRPRLNARIRDVMTRQPRVIQPDATVADAAAMMRRLDVGALPVCDGSRLIGMVTDRDITTRSTAEGRDPHLTPVRDVMSPGVAWATEDDPVEEAARIMREHQIRRLPIVDERHSLVGVVSLGDLATEVGDDMVSGDTLEKISE